MHWFNSLNQKEILQFVIAVGAIFCVSFLSYLFFDLIGYHVVALILLLVVSILAIFFDIFPVVTAAVLSALIWNFFFIEPRGTFKISTPEDMLLFLMYFVIAVMNAVFTTKVRKAEASMRKRKERERTLQLYDTLLNSLSHELKTPIATIIGSVDTLKDKSGKLSLQNREELYQEIDIAGHRLNRQVRNLLHMSRLESDFIQLQLNWHDVNEVINNVIKLNAPDAATHFIKYSTNPDLPLFQFDATLIEQILYNIIHNAIQYTPPGSHIEIKFKFTETQCSFIILDDGPGFPEDKIDRVFEKFYRLPAASTGGTGLGLSIARGFAQAHNGGIELTNRTTGGAKFEVKIACKMLDPKSFVNE